MLKHLIPVFNIDLQNIWYLLERYGSLHDHASFLTSTPLYTFVYLLPVFFAGHLVMTTLRFSFVIILLLFVVLLQSALEVGVACMYKDVTNGL